jgi:cobalt transporter subunit CbtA
MFRRIVLSAVGAGIITGLLVTLVELFAVVPLIQKAELYEEGVLSKSGTAAQKPGDLVQKDKVTPPSAAVEHDHGVGGGDHDHEHGDGQGRSFYTAIATILTAIGYAFLLGVFFSQMNSVGWKKGIAWGLAGFAVFQLAPALGLPPAPPGMAEADVTHRQIWWLGSAFATALGLAACYFAYKQKKQLWALAGVLLIVVPHLIGAPQPTEGENLVPAELARNFAIVALLTAGLFWLVLGSVQGYLFGKLDERRA